MQPQIATSQALQALQPYLARIGNPVITSDGLIVPERSFHDNELQKAVQTELKEFQRKRALQKKASDLMPTLPWQTSLFSQVDSLVADPLGRDKNTQPNFAQLYALSYKCPIVSACIVTQRHKLTALDQVSHDERTPGWRVAHKDYKDVNVVSKKSDEKICRELEEMLLTPDKAREQTRDIHFSQVLNKMVGDHLVFDRTVIEPQIDLKKRVSGYCYVDGVTIKPLVEPVIKAMQNDFFDWKDPAERNKKIINTLKDLERDSNVDLFVRDGRGEFVIDRITNTPMVKKWVQVIEGRIMASFGENDLILGISNPSPRIDRYGYGISITEEATEAIVAWLTSFNTNKNLQTEGIIDGFLATIGDNDPEILQEWRDELAFRKQGVSNVGRIPILNIPDIGTGAKTAVQWINMRPTQKESLYDYWLSYVTNMIISGHYQLHPSELGMKELGTGGTSLSEKSNQEGIDVKAVGHISIMKYIKTQMMDRLVRMMARSIYGRDDFRFFWVGVSQEMSRQEEMEYIGKKYENMVSLTEVRREQGMGLLSEDQDFPQDPEYKEFVKKMEAIPKSMQPQAIQWIMAKDQANMQKEMMQQQQQGDGQDQFEEDQYNGEGEDQEGQDQEEEQGNRNKQFNKKKEEDAQKSFDNNGLKTTTITITKKILDTVH